MQSTSRVFDQPLYRVISAGGECNSVFLKVLVVTIFVLLNAGYLGVNLFELSPLSVTSIRILALFGILILILVQGPRILKIDRSIFFLGLMAMVSAATSLIAVNLIFIFLFLLAARHISINFLATVALYVLGTTVVMSLLLVYFGIVENAVDVVGFAVELGDETRSRMTFGFKNVNAFSGVVSSFCLLFMLVGNHALIRYAAGILISFAFYTYTDSRTMLLTTISFVLFSVIFLLLINHRRLLYLASALIISIPIVISLSAAMVVNQFPLIDLILSGRFTFISEYFSRLPSYRMLIGGIDPPSTLTIDNTYALLTGAVGIPFLLYFSFKTFSMAEQCVRSADYRTYSFLLSFWFFSFSESSMIRPESIICLVFWMLVLKRITTRIKFA